ncbi:MAG: DegT/DnrJ/EryC1/StrS family aminotransferase [Rhizobiaceae bacterium]
MNDLKRLFGLHQDAVEQAALDAMRSGWWLNGPRGKAFAEEFRAYLGVAECLLVANGTDALEITLRALLSDRDPAGLEVVTVANAGGYTTTACRQIGLTPVYADIDSATQTLNLNSAIAALSGKTLAVVATHLYGNVVDVSALRAAMDKAGYASVSIVEDCAQSHGARLGDRLTGTMGDIATFSFYPTKNLGAFGDGGAIVTNDAKLAGTVRALQQYGWRAKYDIALSGARNSRMDEMQAAILSALLPHLDKHNAERNAIMARFLAATGDRTRFLERSAGSVVHLAVALSDKREAFRAFLTERGIASEIHYPILDCDQHGWRDLPQRVSTDGLAASRASVERIVTLPCFPGMSEAEINRVCTALADWEAR